MNWPKIIDLHMHTTVSDGTDTPAEIFERVKEAGIDMFSITDHDAVKGCRMIRELLTPEDPKFITGIEFSCKDEDGKYHILGYGYDPEAESMEKTVALGHSYRMKKLKARLKFLKKEFSIDLPQEDKDRLYAMDNPGKPHIANILARLGFAENKDKAIREFLNKQSFKSQYVRPEEAIEGILGAGGIPVLAHPTYGSGDQLLLGEEMDERLKKLMGFGLQGVEAFYSGFTKRLRDQVLAFADKYDLYVTAGSDYHGANKLVALKDTGCPDASEGPENLKRFIRDVQDRIINQ
ncbi:MAG: PHP domain-containing protein [Lachnospiraceae bacterium]|nr:PHP domain-containing protein [Lachnospiraceae bacterium]